MKKDLWPIIADNQIRIMEALILLLQEANLDYRRSLRTQEVYLRKRIARTYRVMKENYGEENERP